jgi:hypothetical protein
MNKQKHTIVGSSNKIKTGNYTTDVAYFKATNDGEFALGVWS